MALTLCALSETDIAGFSRVRGYGERKGGRRGRERPTIRPLFSPGFHDTEIEKHFFVSLFILDEEAADSQV